MEKNPGFMDQFKQFAGGIEIGGSEMLLLEETGQWVIIAREAKQKVKLFKESKGIGVSPFYIKEFDALTLSVIPEVDESNAFHVLIPINEDTLKQIENLLESEKGIDFYAVSDDLEMVVARKILTSQVSKDELSRQVEQLKEARAIQN